MKKLSIICAVLLVLPCLAFAVDCPVPDTGQTKCYDNTTTSIPCPSPGEPFYGQDANYAPCNPHSYTSLSGGIMVLDNVSGLIWEVKTDDASIHDKDNTYDWQDAQDVFIATLNSQNFGGYNDWRLPTVKELSSLVDSSIPYPGPTINTDYFPNTVSSNYWSSTASYNPNGAWYVYFDYGGVIDYDKSNDYYVRAVRAGQCGSFGNYTDNGDGTITDTDTGLMWEIKTDDGGPRDKDNTYTWQEALSYCESLTLAGYNDWRLPNRNELQSIIDYSTYNPSIDPIFSYTQSASYWSSTTLAVGPNGAWFVHFDGGWVHYYDKSHSKYVRAVRAGQCGSFDDSDDDGISDDEDKCPCHPNGINKGTCVKNVGSVMMSYEEGDELITCDDNDDCTPTGGTCQKVQGDYNWNGIGDVCEGYADFNESGDVNLIDLLDLIFCYGKTNFVTYPQCEKYDINDDNRVSAWDYLILTLQYGRDGFDTCGAGIAPAQIAKTGQNNCYDSVGTEINCIDTGQDGEYQKGVIGPSPRCTDNGDGTVTDNLTGLMWTQDAQQISGTMNWSAALTACNGSSYAGHSDWRLPNGRELISLGDYGESGPGLPSGHPFLNILNSTYWTSTNIGINAVGINLFSFPPVGVVKISPPVSVYTWCTRGETNGPAPVPKTGQDICYDSDGIEIDCTDTGQDGDLQMGVAWPNPRFTDNEDGTITDNLTRLIWLKDANCMATNYPGFDNDDTVGDGQVTWQHSLDFITGINDGTYSVCGAGKTDWRLPNVRELPSLIGSSFFNPPLPNTEGTGQWVEGDPFTNVQSSNYWLSTTFDNSSDYAWYTDMLYGVVVQDHKGNSYYIWPVRGGQ